MITLITGDRVRLAGGPGSPRASAVLSGGRAGPRALAAVGIGRVTYLIPAAARPYVGNMLSPSLFDISALRQAERGGRLPLRITFGGRPPALPGLSQVRVVRSARPAAPGMASGYLPVTQASRFWVGLSKMLRAGGAPGGLSIALAGHGPGAGQMLADADRPARSRMFTLTFRGVNRLGRPAGPYDVVDLASADNARLLDTLLKFRNGRATMRVPAGHYWAIGDFMDFFAPRHPVHDERLVTLPQFTVSRNTTIWIRERSATSKVTMSTPRRAVPSDTSVQIIRYGASGRVNSDQFVDLGLSIWVSPTRIRPTVGGMREYTTQQLVSPRGARGVPYAYYLAFRGPDGVIPRQHYTIRRISLASVNDRFFQDVPVRAALARWAFFPAQFHLLMFEASLTFRVPRHQTEYLTGNPAILWTDNLRVQPPASLGSITGPMRVFHPGQHVTENWDAYPLSPQPNLNLGVTARPALSQPSAARAGNLLRLAIAPFGDGQPGHTGPWFTAGKYAISENGKQVADGALGPDPGPGDINPLGFTTSIRLSRRPSLVRVTLVASRPARQYPLSPRVATTWTWRSARIPHALLPRGWACRLDLDNGRALAPGRRCAVQPLMTLRMTVAGLRLDGSARPGAQKILVQAGHLPLARTAPITRARVRVSFDGGITWRLARLTRTGQAAFTAAFAAPPGSYITLRVNAADGAGASISETIQRGYRIAG